MPWAEQRAGGDMDTQDTGLSPCFLMGESLQVCDLKRHPEAIRTVTSMQTQRTGPLLLGTWGARGRHVPTPRWRGVADVLWGGSM